MKIITTRVWDRNFFLLVEFSIVNINEKTKLAENNNFEVYAGKTDFPAFSMEIITDIAYGWYFNFLTYVFADIYLWREDEVERGQLVHTYKQYFIKRNI